MNSQRDVHLSSVCLTALQRAWSRAAPLPSHIHSHSYTHSHSHTHTLTDSHTHSHSHTHTVTHTHARGTAPEGCREAAVLRRAGQALGEGPVGLEFWSQPLRRLYSNQINCPLGSLGVWEARPVQRVRLLSCRPNCAASDPQTPTSISSVLRAVTMPQILPRTPPGSWALLRPPPEARPPHSSAFLGPTPRCPHLEGREAPGSPGSWHPQPLPAQSSCLREGGRGEGPGLAGCMQAAVFARVQVRL